MNMIEIWAGVAFAVVIAVHFGFRYMLRRLAQMDELRRQQVQAQAQSPVQTPETPPDDAAT